MRATYLAIATELVPGIVDVLTREILPAFLEAQGGDKLHLPHLEDHVELGLSLIDWANRWNLRGASEREWAVEWALLVLYYGVMRNELRNPVYLLPALEVPQLPAPEGFPSYDPGSELRTEYMTRARRRWDTWLQTQPAPHREAAAWTNMWGRIVEADLTPYCRRVEEAYRKLGWCDAPERPRMRVHLTWACRWQVLGHKHSRIAEEEGVDLQTVREVVPRMLTMLDLKPRRGRGRPSRGE